MSESQINLEKDQYLFRQGDEGDQAWLIDDGQLLIQRETDEGTIALGCIGPGECVGEMALISNQPRLASARAVKTCRLTVITRQHLDERLAKSDPLVRHLLQIVLKRYRQSLGQYNEAEERPSDSDENLAMKRMRTEHALRSALDNGEFRLYCQPIVRLEDELTCGFEALLRWRKPDGQLIAPNLFIAVAEESQIIEDIGYWIINEAARCRSQLPQAWGKPMADDFSVSINLAARQFSDDNLIEHIDRAIKRYSLKPSHLRMEVTESQILEDFDQVIRVLANIKDLGCKVAIDDFGTGHSSLAYLHRLPVDTLKIDKAFLTDMHDIPASRHIIANIARLAQDLKLTFIAEGAETTEEIALLKQLGVEQVQGFYFGRPFAVGEA